MRDVWYMYVSAVPAKARRGWKIHLELELPVVLNHPMWLLASELWFSERAAHTPNY